MSEVDADQMLEVAGTRRQQRHVQVERFAALQAADVPVENSRRRIELRAAISPHELKPRRDAMVHLHVIGRGGSVVQDANRIVGLATDVPQRRSGDGRPQTGGDDVDGRCDRLIESRIGGRIDLHDMVAAGDRSHDEPHAANLAGVQAADVHLQFFLAGRVLQSGGNLGDDRNVRRDAGAGILEHQRL